MKYVLMFVILLGTWSLWSGLVIEYPRLFYFGIGCSIFVVALIEYHRQVTKDYLDYKLGLRPILYIPWLLWEIVKSNLAIARVILSPSMPIQPKLIRVTATQKTELGKVIHANSITLTPGTTTLDVRDDTLLVHALTDSSAQGALSGVIDRKVSALEGRHV